MSTVERWTRRLGGAWPLPVTAGERTGRALAYLGSSVAAETAVGAGYTVGVAVGAAVAAVGVALGAAAVGCVTGVVTAVTVGVAGRRAPRAVAALARTRAVGDAADLVARVAVRLRIEPAPERAAVFAARTDGGRLATSLGEHARLARGGGGSGLERFADEWAAWFPALERATTLLLAGTAAPADDRERAIDTALDTVLDGTRDRVAAFAADVRGPLAGLYAFGVLLPLALVGVVPAARASGVRVGVPVLAAAYDVLLPLGVAVVGARLLAARPVAMPPPRVSRDHPDVRDRPAVDAVVGAGGAVVGWVAAATLVAPWSGPVAAAGLGSGAWLVARYRPVKRVRDRIRAAERQLPDLLAVVGRRVATGTAVEAALAAASDRIGGATGAFAGRAVGVQRRTGSTVRTGFEGEHGALSETASPRLRSAAALFALAAREGRPAGDVLVRTGEQFDRLRRVETEGRQELASLTDTLSHTGALFGPLVCGATVALATSVAGGRLGVLGGSGLPAAALGPVVGAYVLLLAAELTVLATGLERGLDPALVGYRVGLALVGATLTYLAAVRAGALLL